MTKEEYIAICLSKWEDMSKINSCDNLYDLELELRHVINDMGRNLLEKQIGEVPIDRRKKKPKKHFRKGGNS